MFGSHDGLVITDAPDSIGAAALSVTVGSTGAFKNLETHELLTQEQLGRHRHDPRTRCPLTSHLASRASAVGACESSKLPLVYSVARQHVACNSRLRRQ